MLTRQPLDAQNAGWFGPNQVRLITAVVALVVMTTVCGAMFWQWSSANRQAAAEAQKTAESVASFVASQSDLLLRAGDLPGVRRLMIDVQLAGAVNACKVELAGVGVVASTETAQIGVMSIPQTWGSSFPTQESSSGSTVARVGFDVPNKGAGSVAVNYRVRTTSVADLATSMAVVVGVCVISILIVGLQLRRYFGAWSSVASSLQSVVEGERRAEVLRVGTCFGPMAEAWNNLLDERDQLETKLVEQVVFESVGDNSLDTSYLPVACDAMVQGLVVINDSGQSIYANGAAAVLLGVGKDVASCSDIDAIFDDPQVRASIRSVFESEESVRKTIEIALGEAESDADPHAELRIVIRSTECGSDRLATVYLEDITQQRLADRSRNAFVAQATHELRTPLTNIQLYVEQAIDAGDDPVIRAEAINVIGSESRRLERIVSDMLSVSEIEAGSLSIRPSPVRTDALFDELSKDYLPQATDKSIELTFDLPPKFPVVTADRDRLGQALHNIIGNAIKYTPSGGKVSVKVDIPTTGGMEVAVTDTGIGIEPDECNRIFERFYRADDRRIAHVTGSGLGLALAQEIARLHGGSITVESEINKGSTFTFSIPGTKDTGNSTMGDRTENRAA